MMKSFTFFNKLAFTFTLAILGISLNAQDVMVFKIASPAGAAGTYTLYRSAFGPQDGDEILDKGIKVADPLSACTALANDQTNSITFLDRGTCTFVEKVKNAQSAGAVAVIICNNDGDVLNPGGDDPGDITIKSFLMEKPDCDKIKVALGAGAVNGNIVVRQCEPVPPSNAVWGAVQGEGDFNEGLNGWTITTEEGKGWIWSADGDCVASFSPNPCNMNTPTICNGAVSVNSNALDVSGDCQAVCPTSIISPNIDLSNVDITALSVQFNQAIRDFGSEYFVITSYDNGLTWADTFAINNDVFSNDAFVYNQVVRVGLCGVPTDITQIRIQFLINANYYFWGIDDVFLVNEAYADPQANNNFWSVAPSLKTPVSQATSFPLLSDVRNNGAVPSPNTVLTARVSRVGAGGLTEIYTQTNDYGTLDACEQVENINFANQFDEPTEVGVYQLDYVIDSDNNKFAANDTRSSRFLMTENVFSNALTEPEFGRAYLGRFISGVNAAFIGANINFWSLGTSYYVENGTGMKASEFRFGVDTLASNGNYSASLTCSVYKIVNNDDNPDTPDDDESGTLTGDERVLVGRGVDQDGAEELFIDNTTEGRRRSKFLLTNLDGGELTLEDNTEYVFMVNVRAFSGTAYFPFLSFNPNSSNTTLRWSYTEATNFANAQVGVHRNFGTLVSRGATEDDVVDERSLATRFFKRMYSEVSIDPATNTTDELDEMAVSVHPNPTSGDLYIDMNLTNATKQVLVEMYDLTGKKMSSQSFNNIRTESLKVNTNTLNTGVYFAKITTDEGTASRKVIVTK
ncbi:MAG: T9SS type A sorting domain-containing protein [Saprospiraceae bacterium]|nr:T9SS type A sorting domain-containing protein [Saprospiraceae bacterium]